METRATTLERRNWKQIEKGFKDPVGFFIYDMKQKEKKDEWMVSHAIQGGFYTIQLCK